MFNRTYLNNIILFKFIIYMGLTYKESTWTNVLFSNFKICFSLPVIEIIITFSFQYP
nr:hypothetical protein CoNPh38_CDS0370 [Staphylococcus phage S-CoN_Ph38]